MVSVARQLLEGQIPQLSDPERAAAVQAVVAIGQAPIVFRIPDGTEAVEEKWEALVDQLVEVDRFYRPIGGIVGYQEAALRLIAGNEPGGEMRYYKPSGLDICHGDRQVKEATIWGIEHLPLMGEIYPVGGAGDRFGLYDEKTGEALPVACLEFEGRTLLEGLVRDLQGREYLYEQLHGEKIVTPIAMMTSCEKRNDHHIRAICEANGWFGRPKESFFLFKQRLVPVVTETGDWCLSGPLTLVRKPGGHGALWREMEEAGVFDWFAKWGRSKALIRQINNPVAGADRGLLVLSGIGCHQGKQFGFAACHRRAGAQEGADVLFEKPIDAGYAYGITNVEYTEFGKQDVGDAPANTNILFADLEAVRGCLKECPLPGLLMNIKKKAPFIDAEGRESEELAGRLETLMQNVAHQLVTRSSVQVEDPNALDLPTFVTYNRRRQTLSGTKRRYQTGGGLADTPEGAMLDTLRNHYELLHQHCGMDLEPPPSEEEYLSDLDAGLWRLPFHLRYHPALGPLYPLIGQKVWGGSLAIGASLELEIADLEMCNLELDGQMRIVADAPLGGGRATLRNVRVENGGEGGLTIRIEGDGEFFAEGVVLEGDHDILVPAGHRLIVRDVEGTPTFEQGAIKTPTWRWEMTVDSYQEIKCVRAEGSDR